MCNLRSKCRAGSILSFTNTCTRTRASFSLFRVHYSSCRGAQRPSKLQGRCDQLLLSPLISVSTISAGMLCNRHIQSVVTGFICIAYCSVRCTRVSLVSRADLFNGAWRTRHELTAVSAQVCLINWSRRPLVSRARAPRFSSDRTLFYAVLCSVLVVCRRGARLGSRDSAVGTSRAHRVRPVSASSLINTDVPVGFMRLTRSMRAPAFCELRAAPLLSPSINFAHL